MLIGIQLGFLGTLKRVLAGTVLSLSVIACGGDEEDGLSGSSTPQPELTTPSLDPEISNAAVYPPDGITRETMGSTGHWAVNQAESLEVFTDSHDAIIIGRATSVDVGYPLAGFILNHFGTDSKETPPPGHPKAETSVTPDSSGRIGPVGSTYKIEVIQVIKGAGLNAGDVIELQQAGGVIDGVLLESDEDPVMRIGPAYLLFLDSHANTSLFTTSPYGRFEQETSGRLRVSNEELWGELPAVRCLNSKDVQEATDNVRVAIENSAVSSTTSTTC